MNIDINKIKTKEDFNNAVANVQGSEDYRTAVGFALITSVVDNETQKVLTVTVPKLNWGDNHGTSAIVQAILAEEKGVDMSGNEVVVELSTIIVSKLQLAFTPFIETREDHENVDTILNYSSMINHFNQSAANGEVTNIDPTLNTSIVPKIVMIFEDAKCESVESAYLKLQALSEGKAALRSLNLDDIFGLLTNCAWVQGMHPVTVSRYNFLRKRMSLNNSVPFITHVDKFPLYLQKVPLDETTRILDTTKVRFGAQLADGTTVMPGASYVNFNAGTLGACMVEGRISSSVIVGKGTDIGGGASIAGVLSGGNTDPITIGENCLLGANSSTAISYGDGCIIDLGCAVASGTKIGVTEDELVKICEANPLFDGRVAFTKDNKVSYFRGSELSGLNGVHYRLDSTGKGLVAFRSTFKLELNEDLH